MNDGNGSADTLAVSRPFVLLAGAGVSAAYPACLPGWWALNDALLSALLQRLVPVDVLSDIERGELLSTLAELRSEQRFPPDYQADFLDEEAGLDYFRGLSVVDHSEPNPFHRFVAELASRGEIAAIITTNFDRMFELAMKDRCVEHLAAFDQTSFEVMEETMPSASASLLILKVHGSAEHPESMVDTRKQRRRGRSRALTACVRHLLENHPLVVAGFSGDDLEIDPEYLGIRAVRDLSPGLTWIAHPPRHGTDPLKKGASLLRAHYGPDRFKLVVDDAAAVFAGLVGEQLPKGDDESLRAVARDRLHGALVAWAETLDIHVVTSMAAALFEAAGLRPTAHRIVRRAWNRGIDREAPTSATSLRRFLRAHARVRLRRGRYDDPELDETIRRLGDLDDPLAESLDLFRQVMLHFPGQDLSWLQQLLPHLELVEGGEPSGCIDAALLVGYAGTVTDLDTGCVPLLEDAMRIAHGDGDEVREALCAIELSLRLTMAGTETGRAEELASFADLVGSGIRDMRIASSVELRRAFALVWSGRPRDAEGHMFAAFRLAMSDELRLHMARGALYWARLAAREDLHFDYAMHELQHLNSVDLGPLASWAILARAERAARGSHPNAAGMIVTARDLASSLGLDWYSREVERISRLASTESDNGLK